MLSPFIFKHHQENKNLFLERFPANQVNRSLQAWDAADEYICNYVEQEQLFTSNTNILIFNDSFGALSANFKDHCVTTVTDSIISHQGLVHNFELNHLPLDNITCITSLEALPNNVSVVLYKVPKNKALLIEQLINIKNSLKEGTIFIAADKAKNIQKTTLAIFEKYLGNTTTSLAVKKARLIFCQLNNSQHYEVPKPTTWEISTPKLTLSNLANVFAREKLDIGARHFIQNLGDVNKYKEIIDLGCGNGIVGLSILAQHPQANITFVDESYMAVASAKLNVENNFPDLVSQCQFITNDCLHNFDSDSVDAIFCNPPFHQQNAVTDHIAWQMFKDSYKVLRKKGELRIVGNRQLGYHIKMKRLFGNNTLIASDNKFVTLSSIKK
ncbi:methyltransferase [Thalassotalea profundi]|uniref:Ribosomal RNA large subunit methyltransferase G n=1 Tax=Thalassotalea profundi TaxID=2036687 RepID=A0ABQ3IKA1_9GAMM|nr:methyltransferase [Thalassotalea profundi]GHE87072.1 ribosomal RNA large subunit methyltransferase G [Thalassotalea profundi]